MLPDGINYMSTHIKRFVYYPSPIKEIKQHLISIIASCLLTVGKIENLVFWVEQHEMLFK